MSHMDLFEASKLQSKFDCNCMGKIDQCIIKMSAFTMEDIDNIFGELFL